MAGVCNIMPLYTLVLFLVTYHLHKFKKAHELSVACGRKQQHIFINLCVSVLLFTGLRFHLPYLYTAMSLLRNSQDVWLPLVPLVGVRESTWLCLLLPVTLTPDTNRNAGAKSGSGLQCPLAKHVCLAA